MADAVQFDLQTRGWEARIRSLLEDLVREQMGVRPQFRLALALWFSKSANTNEQNLLELLTGPSFDGVAQDRIPLLWKTGSTSPPFANVHAMTVDYFGNLLAADPPAAEAYRHDFEVLYFDKRALTPRILEMFNVVTEPPGLLKGWYVPPSEYNEFKSIRSLLSRRGQSRPDIGLLKTGESDNFEYCHGLLHVEVSQRWLPLSPEGIRSYTYYNDKLNGTGGYFLFEGGALYEVLKFEVKTAPEYSDRVLGRTSDDRYPEVYLRAVYPPAQSAA